MRCMQPCDPTVGVRLDLLRVVEVLRVVADAAGALRLVQLGLVYVSHARWVTLHQLRELQPLEAEAAETHLPGPKQNTNKAV